MKSVSSLTALTITAVAVVSAHGADFAPTGTKATLSVEYRFEAVGRKEDRNDRYDWRVKRSADLVAELEARKPQSLPGLQAPDATQTAKLQQQGAQMQKAQAQMAPMMAGAEAIVAKCGNDEKCMEREAMRMGAALSGTKQLDDTLKTGRETAAATQPGADRYQRFEGRTQKGSYTLDESWHAVLADPMCPKLHCTYDMVRKGGGDFDPTRSTAQVEVDAQAQTITLQLPAPHGTLAYTETNTNDVPASAGGTPPPQGTSKGQLPLRVTPDNKPVPQLITLPLKGGWRSQSGEQVVNVGAGAWRGAPGEPGKLVVRWRFTAQ